MKYKNKEKNFMKYKKIVSVLLAVAAFTGIFAGCGNKSANNAGADTTGVGKTPSEGLTKLNVGYLPSPGHLLYFIAQEEGYFEEEGLDVNLVLFNENNSELAALESGKIDVGAFGSSELVTFLADGHELSVFAGAMKAGHALIVKNSLIEGIPENEWTLDLLAGKTIGVESVDSGHIVYREALKKLGYGDDDVNFKIFADGADAYASLKNNEIDGAVLYAPYRILAENEGYTIFSNSGDVDGFHNHVCCRQASLTSELEENPDTYKAFLRALIKAYKFYKEDEDKSVDDIAVYVDVDKDLLKTDTYDYDEEIANPDPDIENMVSFYKALVDLGFVKEFDIEKSLTSDLYLDALNELLEETPNDEVYKSLKSYNQQHSNYCD